MFKLYLLAQATSMFFGTIFLFIGCQYVIFIGWKTDYGFMDFRRFDWWFFEKKIYLILGDLEHSPWILQKLVLVTIG